MGDIQKLDIGKLKDTIISCLVNQLDCYKDIRDIKTKCYSDMSNCVESQLDCYRDIKKFYRVLSELFNEKLLEFDEKLLRSDKELRYYLVDYIDNYVEAYLKIERRKEKEKKDNINKVWLFLFFISFLFIIIYLTTL